MTPSHAPAGKPLPLETLYDGSTGTSLPLPPELADFYGALRFPLREGRPTCWRTWSPASMVSYH